MNRLIAGITGTSIVAILLIFGVCFGTLGGALTGWIVGWFFEDTLRSVLAGMGAETSGFAMWQLGAFLGFVGGFFRIHKSSSQS